MDFYQLARHRHSQRAYDNDRPIPKDLLDLLLDTARHAPSAANRQPWQILVIQSERMRDAVHAAYPRDWFMAAPCILVVKGLRAKAWTRAFDGYNSLETDLAILMDHLTLAATDLGLCTCWIANFDPEVLRQAINLADDEVVYSISPLGYAPPLAPPPRATSREELSVVVRFL
jgi:nitroreductase